MYLYVIKKWWIIWICARCQPTWWCTKLYQMSKTTSSILWLCRYPAVNLVPNDVIPHCIFENSSSTRTLADCCWALLITRARKNGRKRRAEGRRQEAEGRRQRTVEDPLWNPELSCTARCIEEPGGWWGPYQQRKPNPWFLIEQKRDRRQKSEDRRRSYGTPNSLALLAR